MTRRALIVGNWKMNAPASAEDYIANVADAIRAGRPQGASVLVCPPATMIARLMGKGVRLGGQDCHPADSGAHTGDVSARMLAEAGATHVILGHSERRAHHSETDADVAAKTRAAWRADLSAIVCVGETTEQRDAGKAMETVIAQLAGSIPDGATAVNCIVAYEPVWAIGSGRAATTDDIADMHKAIRAHIADRFGGEHASQIRVLYGGSVKSTNASDILSIADVDGALVGGASLKSVDFIAIAEAATAAKAAA